MPSKHSQRLMIMLVLPSALLYVVLSLTCVNYLKFSSAGMNSAQD